MKPPAKKPRKAEAPAGASAAPERLQKILARTGLASRREAEEWIRAGRVSVNGEVASLGSRARGGDQIRLDGRLVRQASTTKLGTWLCHRSPGEPLLPEEGEERQSVADRLPRNAGHRALAISPMPRIDGGLELLTADGELASRLQRAVRGLPVHFSLRVRGELSPEQLQGVLDGELDRGVHLKVTKCEQGGGEGANRWYTVETLGANGRDLRSLFERQAAVVSRVLRTSLGGLALDRAMGRGRTRKLEDQEIERMLSGEPAAVD